MKLDRSLAAVALLLGATAIAVPGIAAARDWGRMHGGMMGGGMMGGGMMGDFDFATVDADKDGKITQAEIDAHRRASVTGLDADADGFISKEEMTAHVTARMQEHVAAMVAQRFTAQDLDGDGRLGAAEMMAPPAFARMFDRVDADGDGAVTEEEIAAARERMQSMRGEGRGRGFGRHGGHSMGGGFGWGMDDWN